MIIKAGIWQSLSDFQKEELLKIWSDRNQRRILAKK